MSQPLDRLRVGIVGCGGAGRAHFWRFRCQIGVEVLAVFDPTPTRVEAFFRRNRVAQPPRVTADWQEFLSTAGMQVVSICSPDHEHARHTIDCLGRGLHVLVEKPMSNSSAAAMRMLAVARAIVEPRRLLLIDEPTKGLAPAIIVNMIEAFRELKDGAVSLLVVEQNFAFARQLGDAVAVMDDGRVAHVGTMEAFAADTALQQHLLGLGMGEHQ